MTKRKTTFKSDISPQDLPVAERNYSFKAASVANPWPARLAIATLACSALILVASGPLRKLLPSPPVPGLRAALGPDGRLLGHFPYPEARLSELIEVAPGLQLRPDAARNFLAMKQAASADGVELVLISAFRPIALQQKLFFDVKADRNQTAVDRAKVSAPPGFSEHSTGYAIDVGDLSAPQANLSRSFNLTPAYQWLRNNAARYQFTLSFPEGNAQGVSHEPWHWRFEGSTHALRLFEPAHQLASQRGESGRVPVGR